MDFSRRLYRSPRERMLFGVAGGLGEYFNVDPTLIRLLFVIATLLGGHGILIYIILAVVVPEAPGYGVQAPLSPVAPPPAAPVSPVVTDAAPYTAPGEPQAPAASDYPSSSPEETL